MTDFSILTFLDTLYDIIWSTPLLCLLVGVGLCLTIALRGIQFRYLGYGLKSILGKDPDEGEQTGDISHFQALMTSLAATIGIGSIAGTGTAVAIGGLGALFWMWVTALVGMSIKFSEAYLGVLFRVKNEQGEMCGGPMHVIERGTGFKKLAVAFALFGTLSSLGGGNLIQANSVADVLRDRFDIAPLLSGFILALVTGGAVLGGIRSIGRIASVVVPFMAIAYVGGALVILGCCYDQVPQAIGQIFSSAFDFRAAGGGVAGAGVMVALRMGVSRGLLCTESGMGTGGIAAAAARTHAPGHQAMIAMAGTFIATFLICTLTALVLAVTHVIGMTDANGVELMGAPMAARAFQSVIPQGDLIVICGLLFFAYTTLLGWAYYGERCIGYLLGDRFVGVYRLLFVAVIIPGAILDLHVVWCVADICNALMTLPNVISLLFLVPLLRQETRRYLREIEKKDLSAPQLAV